MGRLVFSKARKEQKCRACKIPIDSRSWYLGLVGISKRTGKAWTRRYHEQCFWSIIGQIKAGDTSPISNLRSRKARPIIDGQMRRERRQLVALRYYHRRQGNDVRVAEIEEQLANLGAAKREERVLTVDEQLTALGWKWEPGYKPSKEEKRHTLKQLKETGDGTSQAS